MAQTAATAEIAAPPAPEVADADRDALHVLPLATIPLETPALSRARLIKNSDLETVVELFTGAKTGSGQIDIESLSVEFGWKDIHEHPDLAILRKLALLPSFDVYSLRVLLRRHGIPINDHESLRLSEAKNRELTSYMTEFTRPLIAEVYGDDRVSLQNFEDLVDMFRNPDPQKAIARLKMLAERLRIGVDQVPQFLEDYADIFLSLSYYRESLDQLVPAIESFRFSLNDVRKHQQVANDAQIMDACRTVYEVLASSLGDVRSRLDYFSACTQNLWQDISAEAFQEVRTVITRSHTTIGGILCALTVKMDVWMRVFPFSEGGGVMRRVDFITNDMRRGIEKIRHVKAAAPPLTMASEARPQ